MGSSAGPLTDWKRELSAGGSADDCPRPVAGDFHLLTSSVMIFDLGASICWKILQTMIIFSPAYS